MAVTEEPTTTSNDETNVPVDSMIVQEGSADIDAADANDVENEPKDKAGMIKKALIALILLGFIIFVIVDSQTNNFVRDGIVSFLDWVEENVVWGVLVFIVVYFLATICFVPGSILTLGAGFVFSAALDSLWKGILLGTAAVFVGASAGAIASFLLGRYLFRDCCVGAITEKYKIFQAIDNALTNNGLKIMTLLRLSPIIPFNILNYAAGVTGVQFWHYAVACVGMLPGTVLYVFFGASAGSLLAIAGSEEASEDEDDSPPLWLTLTFTIVGIIFGIVAVGVTSYYAKKELDKVLENEEEDGNNDEGEGDEEEQPPADEKSM